jgi:hypothetical protein
MIFWSFGIEIVYYKKNWCCSIIYFQSKIMYLFKITEPEDWVSTCTRPTWSWCTTPIGILKWICRPWIALTESDKRNRYVPLVDLSSVYFSLVDLTW